MAPTMAVMSSRKAGRRGVRGSDAPSAPRRADAERNIATILQTATDLLASRPSVSMADVARAAGVGRVTLYSHFPSRADLVDAVVSRALEETEHAITAEKLDDLGPEEAVTQLLATSWAVLDRFNRIRRVAQDELGEQTLRARHDVALGHLEELIARGQQDGRFRSDLPTEWLVSAFYALMHAAADRVDTGHLDSGDAPALLTESVLSLLRPPSARP